MRKGNRANPPCIDARQRAKAIIESMGRAWANMETIPVPIAHPVQTIWVDTRCLQFHPIPSFILRGYSKPWSNRFPWCSPATREKCGDEQQQNTKICYMLLYQKPNKTLRCFRSSQCVLSMSHLARFFLVMKTCRSLWVPLCWHENSRFKVQSRFVLFKALSCCVVWDAKPTNYSIHSNACWCMLQSRKLDSWTHCWCTRFYVLTLIWQRPFPGLIVIQIWLTPNTNQRLHNFRNLS